MKVVIAIFGIYCPLEKLGKTEDCWATNQGVFKSAVHSPYLLST